MQLNPLWGKTAAMTRFRHPSVFRPLALCLIAVYALAMTASAFAGQHVGAGNIFICAPSGQLTQEARQAAAELAALFGEERPDETASQVDCPLCTLAKAQAQSYGLKTVPPFPTLIRIEYGAARLTFFDKSGFIRAHPRAPPRHI